MSTQADQNQSKTSAKKDQDKKAVAEELAQEKDVVTSEIDQEEHHRISVVEDYAAELDEIAELGRKLHDDAGLSRSDAWKRGYPYDEKMSRKEYEKTKRALQIELLKLQLWIKETGQKLLIILKAAMPRARVVRSSASPSTSTHVVLAWWRSRSPPTSSRPSGTSSVTSSTCPPVAKSC